MHCLCWMRIAHWHLILFSLADTMLRSRQSVLRIYTKNFCFRSIKSLGDFSMKQCLSDYFSKVDERSLFLNNIISYHIVLLKAYRRQRLTCKCPFWPKYCSLIRNWFGEDRTRWECLKQQWTCRMQWGQPQLTLQVKAVVYVAAKATCRSTFAIPPVLPPWNNFTHLKYRKYCCACCPRANQPCTKLDSQLGGDCCTSRKFAIPK